MDNRYSWGWRHDVSLKLYHPFLIFSNIKDCERFIAFLGGNALPYLFAKDEMNCLRFFNVEVTLDEAGITHRISIGYELVQCITIQEWLL